MSGRAFKVGDQIAYVSLKWKRVIAQGAIERETPKFWVWGRSYFRKTDGREHPDYINEHRAILPLAEVPADFRGAS